MQLARSILLHTSIFIITFTSGDHQNARSGVNNKVDYNEFKKGVNNNKSLLIKHPAKDISDYLFKLIDEDIYNYWAGTPWVLWNYTAA